MLCITKAKKEKKVTKVEDLRIVKVYNVVHAKKDVYGDIIELETSKLPNFVLVKKVGNKLKTIPTTKFAVREILINKLVEHGFFVNKVRRNNRYRKPHHLCGELRGVKLDDEQLSNFAEMIEKVSSDLSEERAQEILKNVCRSFSRNLNTQKGMENN